MAWRVVQHADQDWNVSMAVERRAHDAIWSLVLAFRPARAGSRALWADFPLESASKAYLYEQAERISDDHLAAVLAERLAGTSDQ